jgi:Flp pilus assembly protein TadG
MVRERSERGQTLVEFALVIPIVILLMLGLFDLGRIVFINNSLSEGVRHGARHATTDPRDDAYCQRIDTAVRSGIRGQQLNTYTVTYSTIAPDGSVNDTYVICEDGVDAAGKPAMEANITAGPGDRVFIELGADVDLAVGLVAQAVGFTTFNLEAESTMQVTFAPLSTP